MVVRKLILFLVFLFVAFLSEDHENGKPLAKANDPEITPLCPRGERCCANYCFGAPSLLFDRRNGKKNNKCNVEYPIALKV